MKLFIVFFIFAFAVLSCEAWWLSDPRVDPHEEVSQECLQYAAWGRCEFYECLERRFPCGHQGYAVHVGLHFCRKINSMLDDFTSDGYWWMNRTSVCLTNSLLPLYESYATRCGDIKNDGVDGLVSCNNRVDSDGQDFCSFVRDNSDAYRSIFGMEEIQRIVRLRKPSVIASLFVEGARCGADMLGERFMDMSGAFNDMIGSVVHRMSELRDRWSNVWN